jgi:hypothetical protein
MAIYLFNVRTFVFFFSLSLFLLIDKGGVGLLYIYRLVFTYYILLHLNLSPKSSQSHIATDGQSISKSWCRALPSLMRGQVCLFYMLLALASAVFLGLLSHIWDFPFRRLLRLAGSRWRYSNLPPHGWNLSPKSKSKLLYDWRFTANQFVLASSPLRLMTRILFFFTPNWTLSILVLT